MAHRTPQCPKCGRLAFGDDEIARRGRHVLLLGLILAAIMGGVFWMLRHGIVAALGGTATAGFRGSAAQATLALTGFGSLSAFGLTPAFSGAQMIAGRSSRVVTGTAILLFAGSPAAIGALLFTAHGG